MNERPKFTTRGEAFANRELKKEIVAGVEHYVPGQMAASLVTDEEAIFVFLTWVNKIGHVVAMLVAREKDGEWEPALDGYREAGQSVVYPEKKLAEGYKLPERTVRFLNEAEESWQPLEN